MAAGAQRREQHLSRKSGSSASKWWLTVVSRKCCCAVCGRVMAEGAEMVYRHVPGEARCVRCAERREDSKGATPSLRWERNRAKRRGRANA